MRPSWFFRAIKNEYYMYLRDTDSPVRIETKTLHLKLSPAALRGWPGL